MKKLFILFALCLLALAPAVQADMAGDIQKLVGDNATSYVHPITNGIGLSMNSGWYNSSKSYTFFKMPAGLQLNFFSLGASVVPTDLKSYTFKGAVASANLGLPAVPGLPDSLHMNVAGAPTAVGSKQGQNLTLWQVLSQPENGVDTSNVLLQAMTPAQRNQIVLTMPGGLDYAYLPEVPPAIGLTLGLPFKLQLGIRYLPPIKFPNMGEISQFGFKGQYEFTQWIPVFGSLPLLHTSAMYAYNGLNLFDIMKLSNWTAMANVSADFKFLVGFGIYGGLGVENSTMKLDYTVPASAGPLAGSKVSLEDKGDNFFKAMIGARFSFLIFDIYGDVTRAATTSYHLGFALGFNNL